MLLCLLDVGRCATTETMAMICAKCLAEAAAGASRCPACAADPTLAGRYRLDRVLRDQPGDIVILGTRLEDGLRVRIRGVDVREPALPPAIDDPGLPRAIGHERTDRGLWLIHEHRVGQTLAESPGAEPAWILGVIEATAAILERLHARRPPLAHGALSADRILVSESEPGLAPTISLLDPALVSEPAKPADDIWDLGVLAVGLVDPAAAQALRNDARSPAWRDRVDPGLAPVLERMLASELARIDAPDLRSLAARASAGSRALEGRTPPSSPRTAAASPRFLMAEPMPSDGSSSRECRAPRRTTQSDNDDIPVMRPEDLSRELSQAHRATAAIEARQRKQLTFARMLVVLIAATITALATYIALNS